ncbi:hypothetical protein METBIDRAFT_13532 [Metschnikowia bicuspidata var. bicuspidata NRRL YB-4993]|uniref:Uncharacterized protein n=1 Tax=Metschnikowia bicuspidata var. bicuspidata NRRL YB-4993 TaxID=869754 RepID=A0A1A0H5K6_9ASCO|nr:hypothetical protein METBIDRAFT_13532 [Metschnikowia bicuspidata var. bicuspidata NRRL YB-4993]OBA19230.1 hypothetical protein METBIDRAFT_13532 [Metschnikowia bicuspidata var. bicuspidata NRRL YB-4993]
MTRLDSKWADHGGPAPTAPKQDAKTKTLGDGRLIAKPAAQKLPSKWADAPDPEPVHRAPPNNNTQLPTPPSSAGNGAKGASRERGHRGGRRRSEGKPDRSSSENSGESRGSRANGHSKEVRQERRKSLSDSGRSLASRLGSLQVSDERSGARDGKPRKDHAGRGASHGRHPKAPARGSGGESDDEGPGGKMSAAALSFALRLGVPEKERKASGQTPQPGRDKRPAPSAPGPGASRRDQPAPAPAGSRYLTPKQKRALEEHERQARLAKERELKDAQLKAEVQSIFEKMGDKTTSWADLEDESD